MSREFKNGVSIIICFFNAEKRIINTLEHIKKQINRNYFNTELILVNNASNDNTVEIINQTLSGFDTFSWKITNEPKQGLSNARLCGLKNSVFNLLLYCDDDNWLSEDYVYLAEKRMLNNSNIGVLGGLGKPVSSIQLPKWFNKYENLYAVGKQFDKSGQVFGKRNVVYGAGMLIRAEIFYDLLDKGFVFQTVGRKGKKLTSGEDSELCLSVQIMGKQIWYDETLVFHHFIEEHRLTENYLKRLKFGIFTSSIYCNFYLKILRGERINVTNFFWLKEVCYLSKDLFFELLKFNFSYISHFYFIKILLTEKSNYDKKVQNIIEFCKKIEEKS